eukprot:g3936.t1
MLGISDLVLARDAGIKAGKETSMRLNTNIASDAIRAKMKQLQKENIVRSSQTVEDVVKRLSQSPELHLADLRTMGAALNLDEEVEDEVYGWGWGDSGALGTGDFEPKSLPWLLPRMPNQQRVLQIACGARHTLFLTEDTVYASGDNFSGQLGVDCGHIKVATPIEVDLTSTARLKHPITGRVYDRAVQVATCLHSSFCVTEKGAVYGWGENRHGELGNGETYRYINKEGTEVRRPPTMPTLAISTGNGLGEHRVKDLQCGDFFCVALTEANEVITWGLGKNGRLGQAGRLRQMREGGGNSEEIAARIAAERRAKVIAEIVPTLEGERVRELRRRLASRGLDKMGKKDELILRLAESLADENVVQMKAKRPKTVSEQPHSAGYRALKTRGVGTARRKLGDDQSFWEPVEIPFSGQVESVHAGSNFGAAMAELEVEVVKLDKYGNPVVDQLSGEEVYESVIRVVPWTWGCGREGQLGNEKYEDCMEPKPVKLLSTRGITKLGVGGEHCIAYSGKEGKTYAWGAGLHAQLGHCDQWQKAKPYEIRVLRGQHMIHMALGRRHNAVLTQLGLYTWGYGLDGQLGHGNIKSRVIPYEMKLDETWQFAFHNVAALYAGQNTTFASVMKKPFTFIPDGTFFDGKSTTDVTELLDWLSKWIKRRGVSRERVYNIMDVSASATLGFNGFVNLFDNLGVKGIEDNDARFMYDFFPKTGANRVRWVDVESYLFPQFYPNRVAARKAEKDKKSSARGRRGGKKFGRKGKKSWMKSNDETKGKKKKTSMLRDEDLPLPPPKTKLPSGSAKEQQVWVRHELIRRGEDPLTLRDASGTSRSDTISFHEIHIGLNRLGIQCTVGDAKRMFNQMHKQMERFAEDPVAARARKPRELSVEELKEARITFDQFDADGGGSIDCYELLGALQSLGMDATLLQAKKIIEAVDVDGDESVDFEEFKWMLAQIPPLEGGIHHRIAFKEVNLALRKRSKREILEEKREERRKDAERKRKLKEQWAKERRELEENIDSEEDLEDSSDFEERKNANENLLSNILE